MRPEPCSPWRRQARDVRLPRLHPYLWEEQERAVLAEAQDHHEADAGEAAGQNQLKRRRHEPIPEQGRWLGSVVRGHLAYYAVPGNTDAVQPSATRYPGSG